MSTLAKGLIRLTLVLSALSTSTASSAAIVVRDSDELAAAVARLRTTGGTIVMRPNRYGSLAVGPRAARWLVIRADGGASVGRVTLHGTRFVKVTGLRLTPGRSGARLEVSGSDVIWLTGMTAVGRNGLAANVSVLNSRDVVIERSTFSRCGEGKTPAAGYCIRVVESARVRLASSRLHDCLGCDFVHGRANTGLTIRRNTFDRALVGRCGTDLARCHHQDLIQLQDGSDIRIDANRFGIQQWPGAAQIYLTGAMRRVRVTNNLFVGTDPSVPDVESPTAIWVGNRVAAHVPLDVSIVQNTILTGRPRLLKHDHNYTSVSILVSPLYRTVPLVHRPVVANNVLGLVATPWRLCPYLRASVANVVVTGAACTTRDHVAAPALGPEGEPTAASRALIDRAALRYATTHDRWGRPRGRTPDIGAYEYLGT